MTREQLIASLTASVTRDALTFDDGRYIDWSVRDEDEVSLELGDGDGATNARFSWDEIRQLQQSLTVLLLEHDA